MASNGVSTPDLKESALDFCKELEASHLVLTVFDGEDVVIVFCDNTTFSDEQVRRHPAIWLSKIVIENSFRLVIRDIMTHPLTKKIRDNSRFPIGSYLGVPIFMETNEIAGSIGLFHWVAHNWSDEETSRISEFAERISRIISK